MILSGKIAKRNRCYGRSCIVQYYTQTGRGVIALIEEQFVRRLTELRMRKGVSARAMSLSIGQSPGYINNIENGKNLPSMMGFFYICEYLGITPEKFFDFECRDPSSLSALFESMRTLTDEQIAVLTFIVQSWRK